ncbi:VOC family protein [Rossellomorea sp. YZS02]|uniref:VOC family protein n=1 Tax=Rossellomorea sp. YZS02 TaxID=3097358 RepID=UPI002A123946|nr:VOC family protein [Rossellomorea sp. YZS02]MDX8344693.1 VOC family protein [Rossellomorea sp. YZS02]
MKLAFLCHPVTDLKKSLNYYRDTLGFEEAWREGDHTIALKLPGTDVQLMIENDEADLGPGGIFIVDSVDGYFEQYKEKLHFIKTPSDIPPGRYAIFQDESENLIRIIDLSREG